MALHQMWVHGHSAQIEFDGRARGAGEDVDGIWGTNIAGLRKGKGVFYRCPDNTMYWFHFAIPTPVFHAGAQAKVVRAMLLYTTDPGVALISVHVWDGPFNIAKLQGFAVGGPNLGLVDEKTRFALPPRKVNSGIGISALFTFADPGTVTLHAAGAEFEL